MRADIDAETERFPDLLARSSEILRDLLGDALGEVPGWARKLSSRTTLGSATGGFGISSPTC